MRVVWLVFLAACGAAQEHGPGTRFIPTGVDWNNPVYATSFDRPATLRDWRLEGGRRMAMENGNLVLESADAQNHLVCWLDREMPADFLLEFTVRPQNRKQGLNIVFFNARGVKGERIFDPSLARRDGTFKQYHSGDLNNYHFSYWAGERGLAHLRKNQGFHLVAKGNDLVAGGAAGAFQTIRVYKRGGKIRLMVDDVVSVAFDDDGKTYGPVHRHSGWIGLRQMGHTGRCEYGHFKVFPLSDTERPGVEKHASNFGDQWLERRLTGRNDTVPLEAASPYPTLTNLSLEWKIEGDDNLNGVVTASYRKAGETQWRRAMPLRRVPARTFKDGNPKRPFWPWENKHAGSILDLEPDTEYEIRLALTDPDGGRAERTLRARTRPVPRAMPGARLIKVNPETLRAEAERARPGDVLLLAPGTYGFFSAPRDGEPGKPIVFRADPDDRVGAKGKRDFAKFDGFSLTGRKHVHVEGILSLDTIDLFNAEDCVVRRCVVHALWGIVSGWSEGLPKHAPRVAARLSPQPDLDLFVSRERPRQAVPPHSRNCYIADNVVIGATPWLPESIHAMGKNLGEGIEISGPGNVVCHNLVTGYRDCISLMEGPKVEQQNSIDIYNNDIYFGADDGIEADYMMTNCRILRNRITNCMRGIAAAPVLGGPAYLVRNVLYNVEQIWQLGRIGAGYVVLHNTSVKSGAAMTIDQHLHSYLRNNLLFGGGRDARSLVRTSGPVRPGWDMDYNGYGAVGMPFKGEIAGVPFDSLESLRRTMEKHGVQVGLDVFQAAMRIPASLFPAQAPPDFRLRPGSAAVDAGETIPNVNDGFTGKAPDLGAIELGSSEPVYGPRPSSEDIPH